MHVRLFHQPCRKLAVPMILLTTVSACSLGTANPRAQEGRLAPCPPAPHCVSSQETRKTHQVAPLKYQGNAQRAQTRARAAISQLGNTTVIVDEPGHLVVECRTPLLGFVDDLELLFNPSQSIIDVRSASRIGYYDFEANRKRTETLRQQLTEAP